MQTAGEENGPSTATPQGLLDRCLVDGDDETKATERRRRRQALGISLAIETAALLILIVAPLLTSIAQPKFSQPSFVPFLFGAVRTHSAAPRHSAPSNSQMNRMESFIRFTPGHVSESPAKAPQDSGDTSILDGNTDGLSDPGAINIGSILPAVSAPPPTVEIRKPEGKRPMKVSAGVEQAQLISRIEPRYPFLAVQTKTEGTVILHAIISRDGAITALDVISGHPLLVRAALDAVRQWRYRPTLLNGEPVEVETTITVIFQLQH